MLSCTSTRLTWRIRQRVGSTYQSMMLQRSSLLMESASSIRMSFIYMLITSISIIVWWLSQQSSVRSKSLKSRTITNLPSITGIRITQLGRLQDQSSENSSLATSPPTYAKSNYSSLTNNKTSKLLKIYLSRFH